MVLKPLVWLTVVALGFAGAVSAQGVGGPLPGSPSHVICDSGCSGATGGGTVAQGTPATTGDATAWPFKVVFGGAQIDPRDVSDRAARALGKITFDGTQNVSLTNLSVAVTGTFWQVTQPVSIATMPSTPVTGTFWQSTQPVSLATLPALTAGSAVIGHVVVDTAPSTAVTGTFWQLTQPVSGTFWQSTQPVSLTTLPALVAGTAVIGHVIVDTAPSTAVTNAGTFAVQAAQGTAANLNMTEASAAAIKADVDKIPSQGQALAAASMPVILPSATITALTPPAAITGFALEAGHLATIDSHTPALGQALAAASVPVILPSATITTLTPPAAITGFALDATLTGGTQQSKITDGTNVSTVKAASTLPALTDKALVTTQRDPLPAGTNVLGHVIADTGSTTAVTGTVTTSLDPTVAATEAMSAASKATVTSSVNVKASAGNVYGFSVLNGAGVGCWMELINSATAGTLGTAVIFNIALPTSGTLTLVSPMAMGNFSAGIAVGVASAVGGASACGTATTGITIFYK